jgi:hypothetical protein
MKKWLVLGLAVVGLASIAASCRLINISLTEVDGEAVFAGEFTNETGANFEDYRVRVAFVEDGDVIDEITTPGCPRTYQNGQSIFFSASSDEVDDIDDTAGLAVIPVNSTLKAGDPVAADLELSDVEATRADDDLRVTGDITNDGNDDVDDARACVVVYDEDGNVVVVAIDNALLDIDEDDTASFSVDVKVPDEVDLVDHVDVYVDALIDGNPTDYTVDDDVEVDECADATATPTGTPPATNTPVPSATATPTDPNLC